MKRHLSVLLWIARSSIYRILGVYVLMAAAQTALWYNAMQGWLSSSDSSLEKVIDQSGMLLVFASGFLLQTVLLCLTGCAFGSRVDYTLQRLCISERTAFLWQAGYNTVCYLLLWAMQLVFAFCLGAWYAAAADAPLVSGQTVFLAFLRSSFWHNLLPLDAPFRLIRSLLMTLAMGVGTALVPYRQRHRRVPLLAVVVMVMTLLLWNTGIEELYAADMVSSWFSALAVGYGLYSMLKIGGDPDETQS